MGSHQRQVAFFEQWSIVEKSGVKVEKRLLVAELKMKMAPVAYLTFSISASQPEGAFPL